MLSNLSRKPPWLNKTFEKSLIKNFLLMNEKYKSPKNKVVATIKEKKKS